MDRGRPAWWSGPSRGAPPPCCGEPCPLRGSLLLAKRVGVRFRRVVRPPPQSGFRRSVEPRQRRGVAGAPPTRIDLLRDDESPATLGFGASQLRAALPFRNRRPEPHSAAARPPLYLLRRLEILRDGGRHDDPELQAEPEQDEDAPCSSAADRRRRVAPSEARSLHGRTTEA